MRDKNIKYLLFFVAAVIAVIIGLGRLEFHNELERDIKEAVFLGYLNEQDYSGTVTMIAAQWPAWTNQLDIEEQTTVVFPAGKSGKIGIFADLVYYENRFEQRVWLTGRLLKKDSEYYYRQDGPLRLQPIYESDRQPAIDLSLLKGKQYDYLKFRGTR